MGGSVLVDSVVRQTTVLIAGLATASGNRASLANVANEVLASLVTELKTQGLGSKVIADMFGMALRTYYDRVARLGESQSDSGRSLWDAVLAHVQERGPTLRPAVLSRFARDDEGMVKGVLRDLVRSGLVFASGHGDGTVYRAVTLEEQGATRAGELDGALANLVLVAVHRNGPCAREAIQKLVPIGDAALDALLAGLVGEMRLRTETENGVVRYRHDRIFIPYGDPMGWEAAVLDHYQAVVTAICAKLSSGRTRASADDTIGGSTFHLDVWSGHPLEREALGLLASFRRQAVALREAIERHNATHTRPDDSVDTRIVTYVGQNVSTEEDRDDP
jgi:hypothetical protein